MSLHKWRFISAALFIVCLFQLYLLLMLPLSDNNIKLTLIKSDKFNNLWRNIVSSNSVNNSIFASTTVENNSDIIDRNLFGNFPSINVTSGSSKIVIIIIFVGDQLPSWCDTFLYSLQSTAPIVDWMLFVTEIPPRELPRNVKFIPISRTELSHRISLIDDNIGKKYQYNLTTALENAIRNIPYILVEFKPCLGYIFQDYLTEYTHWGYADLDTLLGRIPHLLPSRILQHYDIYTVSFGDTFRHYLRGQLTIHRNNNEINNLWRSCVHLSKLSERLYRYAQNNMSGSTLQSWGFQSAEGCYSKVVMDNKKIRVYVAAAQISDAFGAPLSEKESLVVGQSLLKCYEQPLWSNDTETTTFLQQQQQQQQQQLVKLHSGQKQERSLSILRQFFLGLSTNQEERNEVDASTSVSVSPLQMSPLKCSYWVHPAFQSCLSFVTADSDVSSSNGRLEQFKSALYTIPSLHPPSTTLCREAVITHYQGWKKVYYHFTTRPPSYDTHMYLVTDTGFIPLRLAAGLAVLLPTYQQIKDFKNNLPVPVDLRQFGKLNIDIFNKYFNNNNNNDNNNSRDKAKSNNNFMEFQTIYCSLYSNDFKKCLYFLKYSDMQLLLNSNTITTNTNNKRNSNTSKGITLITVTWAEDLMDDNYSVAITLNSWKGPKIILVAYATSPSSYPPVEPLSRITERLSPLLLEDIIILAVNVNNSYTIHKQYFPFLSYQIPEYMLYNIGLDLSVTDSILVLPAGNTLVNSNNNNNNNDRNLLENKLIQIFDDKKSLSIPAAIVINSGNTNSSDTKGKRSSLCSRIQPAIQRSFKNMTRTDSASSSEDIVQVEVDFGSLLWEKVAVLPVAFDRTQSLHGVDFIRFPEELSNGNCFGTSILAVLVGSGYTLSTLHLSNEAQTMSSYHDELRVIPEERREGRSSSAEGSSALSVCGCQMSENKERSEHMKRFLNTLNRYFIRAKKLRATGIPGIYAKESLNARFDKEQWDLALTATTSKHKH